MPVRVIANVVFLMLIVGSATVAFSQRTGSGGTVTERPKPKPPVPAVEPTQKTRAEVRIIRQYIPKPVTPTTGRLFVSAEPGAVILVEPLTVRNTEAQKGKVPDGRRDFVFNDLKPGSYRVAATLEGFHEVEQSPVTIKKNDTQSITLYFQPILYSVTISTNVDAGDLKYGKEGQKPNVETIQGKTIKLQLPAGDYVIEITPDEGLGYKERQQRIAVKDNMNVEFPLERIRFSTDAFSVSWSSAEIQGWEMPQAWHVESKNLIVKGNGVALPRDENKRYYKDFQLTSTVKILNGVGAGFALRARDSQNYYLLELTGEKADEPYTVRLFVVKNGAAQRIQAQPIVGAPAAAIKAGQFSAVVRMTDNRIKIDVEDSKTGLSYPLGVLTDPNRNFTAGAVGIAARGNEENAVWIFYVCTDCLKS